VSEGWRMASVQAAHAVEDMNASCLFPYSTKQNPGRQWSANNEAHMLQSHQR